MNYKKAWFELKESMIEGPMSTNKNEILRMMALIEIDAFNKEQQTTETWIPFDPTPPGVIVDEIKGISKFFKR